MTNVNGNTNDGTLGFGGRGAEGLSVTDVAVSGFERTPQSPLSPEELRDGVRSIFDDLLSRLPAGPTTHSMRFGTRGQLDVHTDPSSPASLSGSHLTREGSYYSTFSAINSSGEENPGSFQIVRKGPVLMDPEKYRGSIEGLAFLKAAMVDLFAGEDGSTQPDGIPSLAEAKEEAERLLDSYR